MKVTELVRQTIIDGKAHPTAVLNALIELENAGGLNAVYELEYRLARLAYSTQQILGTGQPLITDAWLGATKAYLQTYDL